MSSDHWCSSSVFSNPFKSLSYVCSKFFFWRIYLSFSLSVSISLSLSVLFFFLVRESGDPTISKPLLFQVRPQPGDHESAFFFALAVAEEPKLTFENARETPKANTVRVDTAKVHFLSLVALHQSSNHHYFSLKYASRFSRKKTRIWDLLILSAHAYPVKCIKTHFSFDLVWPDGF